MSVASLEGLSEAARRKLLAQLLSEKQKQKQEQAKEPFPLSVGQQGLWFIYQLDPQSAAYNVALPMRIDSAVEPEILRQTFQILLDRHPALRTFYRTDRDVAVQEERRGAEVDFCRVDASAWSADALAEQVQRAYLKPFDLEQGPVLRVHLFEQAEDRWVLLFAIPHIAADAWSFRLLIDEIGELYPRLLAGENVSGEGPKWSYRDFVRWQRERLQGVRGSQLWEYWREALAGDLPTLELPADRPRPAVQSFRGGSLTFGLPKDLVEPLKALARFEKVTLFVALLGAYQTLLYRYTGERDLIVGTPMAGRSRSEFERLVGYFVNLVPLRCQLGRKLGFRDLVQGLRRTVLEAIEHQDFPYETLVERLSPERDAGRTALFQVLFEFQKKQEGEELVWLTVSEETEERMTLGGLRVGFFPLAQQEGKFDLQLEMAEKSDGLFGIWKFNADLFDPATLERMSGHFKCLIKSLVADPGQSLAELPLLTSSERQTLLAEWNVAQPIDGGDLGLHQRFERVVSEQPNETALIYDLDELTYRELDEQANQLARVLKQRGVGPEVPVCLMLERSFDQVIAILAVLKAGGAYVPIDPEAPAERIAYVVEDSASPLLVTRESLSEHLTSMSKPSSASFSYLHLDADRAEIEAASIDAIDSLPVPAERLAYVIYTSGSTGKPKGVQVTHGNVSRLFDSTAASFAFGPQDVWTLFHSYAFDFSVWEIWGPLLHGGSLVIVPFEISRSPEAFHDLLRTERVSVLNQTPAAFYQLVEADEQAEALTDLRLVIFGGEALDLQSIAPWLTCYGDAKPSLVNMYGITETTVHVTERLLSAGDLDLVSSSPIGRAIRDLRLLLLDPSLKPVPVGLTGEILVGGAGLARGYLRRGALTAERFVPDPYAREVGARLYRSGDLARYRPNGDLEFLGRLDHQVKIRGFRIELGEIEAALGQHPEVRQASVLVRPDAAGDASLVAYVVPRNLAVVPSTAEWQRFAADRLPSYMVPGAFVVLAELPLTTNGKLDRKALPDPEVQARGATTEWVAPRTETEARLAALWCDVLRLERVGTLDHFFEVGGHSLQAVRLTSRLREAFRIDFPVQAIFEFPQLEKLAAHLDRLTGLEIHPLEGSDSAEVPKISRENPLQLSFAQERLWFLDRLEGQSSVAYNVPMVLEMRGRLKLPVLRQSLRTIARRHEALRTVFRESGGRPAQVVRDEVRLPWIEVDLAALEDASQRTTARALAAEELHRSFDLGAGPLWRAVVLRFASEHHWLILTCHHIVSDGWSTGLLHEELAVLYRAGVRGEIAKLPRLDLQYADYAAWQRQQLDGEARQPLLDYWTGALAGAPALLALPTDRPRPTVQSFRGGLVELRVPERLAERLRRLSQQHGTTLYTTLLAAFQTLLFRHSGQRDLCVGSPVANRNHRAFEGLIGCFVNTIVMRTQVGRGETFSDLLSRAREQTLGAISHESLPFELLVEALQPTRDLSRNPLFQAFFALLNTPSDGLELPGLELVPLMPESEIAKFDLTLSLVDAPALIGYLEYNRDLFDRSTLERLAEQVLVLFEAIGLHPQARLEDLPLLPAAQREALLGDWSDGGEITPPAQSLDELVWARAEQTPDRIALVDGEARLSYADLSRRSRALALQLRALGVGPESFVGLCTRRSAKMVCAMLGVLTAGGAYVPLDPEYPAERLGYILDDARAQILITEADLADLLPAEVPHILLFLDDLIHDAPLHDAPLHEAPSPWQGDRLDVSNVPALEDRLAYLIYTSGSTGRPKGVAIDHRSVVALFTWAEAVFSDEDLSGVLAATSICFDLSVFELFLPLTRGGSVMLAPNLLHLPSLPASSRISLINSVPSAVGEVLRGYPLPESVRVVNLAGEPIRRSLIDQLYEQSGVRRVFNLYGPSEDTTYSTFALLPEVSAQVPAIGCPVGGTSAYLLDDRGQPVPQGVSGEILLAGRGVARGYFGRPALTAERFVPDPFASEPGARLYRTGDLSRYRNDGELEFLGRRDKQVKVRGFRIELGEIEEALSGLQAIEEAAVQVRHNASGDAQLVAFVAWSARKEAAMEVSELRSELARRLPAYLIPTVFIELPALPRTPNGKLDSSALPELDDGGRLGSVEFVAPEAGLQQKLAEAWREVLHLETVGVDDNFFDLGGHSLLMARFHSHLLEAMPGVEVTLIDLFQYPTVRSLTAFLESTLLDPMLLKQQRNAGNSPTVLEASRQRAASRRRGLRRRGRRRQSEQSQSEQSQSEQLQSEQLQSQQALHQEHPTVEEMQPTVDETTGVRS